MKSVHVAAFTAKDLRFLSIMRIASDMEPIELSPAPEPTPEAASNHFVHLEGKALHFEDLAQRYRRRWLFTMAAVLLAGAAFCLGGLVGMVGGAR